MYQNKTENCNYCIPLISVQNGEEKIVKKVFENTVLPSAKVVSEF